MPLISIISSPNWFNYFGPFLLWLHLLKPWMGCKKGNKVRAFHRNGLTIKRVMLRPIGESIGRGHCKPERLPGVLDKEKCCTWGGQTPECGVHSTADCCGRGRGQASWLFCTAVSGVIWNVMNLVNITQSTFHPNIPQLHKGWHVLSFF